MSAGWLANGKAVAHEATAQQYILARQSRTSETTEAVADLIRVRGSLAKLSQLVPSPKQAVSHRIKVESLREDEQRLIHDIGGQLASLSRTEPWVTIEEIRHALPAGRVLVDIARFRTTDFQFHGQKTDSAHYAAWVVPRRVMATSPLWTLVMRKK